MRTPPADVALDLPRMRFMSAGMRAYAEELAARLPRVAPDLQFATIARRGVLDLGEQVALPLRLRLMRPRLVHHLAVYAPLLGPRPSIVTIHDLIHLRFPALFKRRVRPYYATVVRTICARAARVITDDDRTVDDLERYLGVSPQRIAIVPLGADDRYFDDVAPVAHERPYFIYVGNHRPHKDLATLFAAWELLDPALDVDLFVTGNDDLPESAIRPRRGRGRVRYLGDVRADELPGLYRGAVALVHPALCEGFGLPLLEAAALGTHVIACRDAVPAVLRPYVEAFAPRDVGALATAMRLALLAPRDGSATRAFARTLTWDRCASATAEVYRSVLAERSPR
ncbi:MAG: glycosyltransferase family 1 protein [Vulcanimicrobiaceae bacterium]